MLNRNVWSCLILLIMGRTVLADTGGDALKLEQLVSGLNLESKAISNGEAKILSFEIISPNHTPEQAKQWLEERKVGVRSSARGDNNSSSVDESQFSWIFSDLELQATLKTRPKVNRQEYDIAFEVYDHQRYKYREAVFDRRVVEKGSPIAQSESTGWQRVITYDGEIQSVEKELQNGVRYVKIYSGDSHHGFIPFFTFGRITLPLRAELVEFVEIENSEDGERYVIKIRPPETN